MKTSRLIRFVALLLALLTLSFSVVACKQRDNSNDDNVQPLPDTSGEQPVIDGDGFAPVIRFAAASDIHTRSKGSEQATQDELDASSARLSGLFSESYAYAQSNPYYQKLDAVILVGDYTDHGRQAQYDSIKRAFRNVRNAEETQLLACLGNHEFWDTGENGTTSTSTAKTYARFQSFFGMEADSHVVINGFHFIGVSPDTHGGRSYTIEKSTWLKGELETALADDPTKTKPIFVYLHMTPNDLAESETYSNRYIKSRLASYPQVVVLAGHSHQIANNPRAITQGDYTVVNTGTMAYGWYGMFTNDGSTSVSVSPRGLEGGYIRHAQ